MKFALILPNLAGGGAERGMLNLGQLLAARGHDVTMLLLEHHIEHEPPPGLRVHALTPPGRRMKKGWLGRRQAARRLRRWVHAQAEPFDVIVSTLPFADEIVARAGLRNVWFRIANTLSEEIRVLAERSPRKAARRRRRYRRVYGGARLVTVSDGVAADLREHLDIHDAEIRRIHNPIDFARIERLKQETPAELPETPYLVHVGRFARQKRHDVLLDAWQILGERHPEAPDRLVLLTADHAELRDMIAARGLDTSVVVAGFQTNPYPWIAGAEMLVLSSEREGMPNVLVEALACGTRVVSTDCRSGPREILGDIAPDALCAVNDPHALAGSIARQLAHPLHLAPDALRDFAVDHVLDAYEGLATERRD